MKYDPLARILLASAILMVGSMTPARADTITRSKADVCDSADIVVIGKVINRQSRRVTGPVPGIRTNVTFQVERIIHGPQLSSVMIDQPGGSYQGSVEYWADSPSLPLNSRYLLVLTKQPNQLPRLLGGMEGARRLDPNATLPTNQELAGMWTENCDE